MKDKVKSEKNKKQLPKQNINDLVGFLDVLVQIDLDHSRKVRKTTKQ